MILSKLDHIVAVALAAARAAVLDLETREEYLAEYDAFLSMMATRNAEARAARSGEALESEATDRDARHIPCSV